VGSAVPTLDPTVIGTVSTYTVAPSLPAGLTLDATTGVISGTPTVTADQATYTVTASNSGGSAEFALVLTVNPAPTMSVSYPSPDIATVGVALTITPSVTGTVTAYSVAPALPAGLNLNPATGVISGTATAAVASTTYTITASNSSASATFSLSLTVQIAAPSGLSYTSPSVATVGVAFAPLTPTVTGTVTSYTVAPALPAGLTLNPTTGVISGTPTAAVAAAPYTITASNSTGATTFSLSLTVRIAAPSGLSYTSPAIAVVAVAFTLSPTVTGTVTSYTVTPALPGGLTLNPTTGVISGTPTAAVASAAYTVTASNSTGSTSGTLTLQVNASPTVLLTVNTTSANLQYYWKTTDGQIVDANGLPVMLPETQQVYWMLPQGPGIHFAYVLVSDGNGNCSEARMAVNSDSFGAASGKSNVVPVAKPDYSSLNINCPALHDPFFFLPAASQPAPLTSMISSITAVVGSTTGTYTGTPITFPTGYFQQVFPNPIDSSLNGDPEPSNAYLAADQFLTYLGEDTAQSACQYYQAILANSQNPQYAPINNCASSGNISFASSTNPVFNFTSWQANNTFIAGTNALPTTYFVNVVDLNLTREHHSTTYTDASGNQALAAYVCNHLPPTDASGNLITINLPDTAAVVTSAQQQAVETALTHAVAGSDQIACVAMDYQTNNNGVQYTRFFVFGPSGELLPSVNLDGRGEKYVPGACVACHGGNTFNPNAANPGNVSGNFLPYDTGNFAFSMTQVGLTATDEAKQLFELNNNISKIATDITVGTLQLIDGWYGYTTGAGFPFATVPSSIPPYNINYIPSAWQTAAANASAANATIINNAYTDVVARSCRTCHTALYNQGYDWDTVGPLGFAQQAHSQVCTGTQDMPNALLPFNRFWDSHIYNSALAANTPDQPAELIALLNSYGVASSCPAPTP
jgi:mono/diheme cytochrome c family protein